MQLDQYAGMAVPRWPIMRGGEWRGEEASRTDSMHVRYYTVFSVYLFYARLRGAQHSAIRNYSGACVAERGHIRPYVVRRWILFWRLWLLH